MPIESNGTLDIQSFLDGHRFTPFQWLIFVICLFVVVFDGFDTAAIGYIAPSLIGEWHVAKPDLAPVLSAALFGIAFGALTAGPLADKFGRKAVLVVAVGVMGVASLIAATASALEPLTIWRFITGLGLGAAMPNAVTMISEYCPKKTRSMITSAMFCGFPLGAALGGFIAAWLIPHFGWRSVLILGGVVPLALGLAMAFILPESLRYLVARQAPAERIRKTLAHISTDASKATGFVLNEPQASSASGKSGLALLFSKPYIVGSMMLWIAYFMGLVIFYGLINWMPILFKETGIPAGTATLISALFPFGGFGAIGTGWLMDRFNANRIVAVGFLLTAVGIYAIGQTAGNVGLLALAVFVAGAIMNTSQTSLPALAAMFYPTQGRATGVSWMLGVGRFGGIAGTFLFAELARRKLGFSEVFLVISLPALIAAGALFVKQFFHPAGESDHIPVTQPFTH